jgi:hypothetical protein
MAMLTMGTSGSGCNKDRWDEPSAVADYRAGAGLT